MLPLLSAWIEGGGNCNLKWVPIGKSGPDNLCRTAYKPEAVGMLSCVIALPEARESGEHSRYYIYKSLHITKIVIDYYRFGIMCEMSADERTNSIDMDTLYFGSLLGLLWPAEPIKHAIHLLLSLADLLDGQRELLVLHFQKLKRHLI